LENWGVDYVALRETKVTRVFRAWVEDWEKEAIKSNDAVAEVRLLEKYKDLVFVEASTNKTFTIHSENMEWYRSNRKRGIDGGWYLIGTHEDDVAESFAIEDELCNDIADTPQAEGIQIIRRDEGEEE
jgi:hypothetical protein